MLLKELEVRNISVSVLNRSVGRPIKLEAIR